MSATPFRDMARKIAMKKNFIRMSVESDEARSHSWWKNVVEKGAWGSAGAGRVGPPTPETLPGIAKLFGTSEERVCEMIAADWYSVSPNTDVSQRSLRMSPLLDALSEADADLVERLIQRLAKSQDAA